jgi:PAS domain S-box-containing protein
MNKQSRSLLTPAVFLCIAISAVVVVTSCQSWKSEQEQAQNAGVEQAKSDVLTLRRRFDETLKRVSLLEASGLLVQNSYSNNLPDFADRLDSLRRQIAIAGSEFALVSFADSTGFVKWSTYPLPENPVSVTDRDYFRILSTSDIDRVVGNTTVGKIRDAESLPFVFKIRDFDEKFKGVLTVRVEGDFAKILLNTMDKNKYSMVSLVRADGQYLARSVHASSGAVSPSAATLPKIVTKSITDTQYAGIAVSPIDRVERFLATSYNSQWDLLLIVGNETGSTHAMLEGVKRRIFFIAISLILGGIAVVLSVTRMMMDRQDIEQNLSMARDLARREGVLLQIAQKATDMIALMDSEFRYLYANEAFRLHLGLDPLRSIGKRMGHSVAWKPDVEACLEKLAREGGSARCMVDVQHINGSMRWLEVELVAVDIRIDDSASPCRYFSISRDVTERVLAEQKVAASQQRLENIMRVGPGFSYEVRFGKNGAVQIDLPVAVPDRLLGYSVEEATKNGMLWEQTAPDYVKLRLLARRRCLETGWASIEFNARAKDGSTHRMLSQLRKSTSGNAGPAFIGFMADISSEYEVRMRLRHSEQLAILGLASANIAHDMNQPLASLALAVENTLAAVETGKATPERLLSKLATIGSQAQRLADMVNRVRKFSRDERGTISVFALSCAVEEAIALSGMRVRTVGVEIDVAIATDVPELHTDRLLLEQVLVNLIVNACDAYSSQRSTAVSDHRLLAISANRRDDSLVIQIADHAGGIAADIMPNLFKTFVTNKPADLGTGLGLSICASNIRMLGGEITACNRDNGAVFEITLPIEAVAGLVLAEQI